MKIAIGKEGTQLTWQEEFPEEIKCGCGGVARIAFAVQENVANDRPFVCHLYENQGAGGFWPHDAIAVAIYFCKECFKAVVLWNQA